MAYNALKGGVNLQSTLIRKLAPYRWDPLGFVERVFPWGTGELINSAGPRRWQRQLLTHIGQHLHSPATRHQPTLNAVSSGHGIGKSALVAMITLWAMCQPDCKAVITANTEVQLRTKTWPELAKWYRLALHKHWFNFGATSITARDPKHERTWRCDMVPWSETNTEAFAGLHNQGNRILLVFDEASESTILCGKWPKVLSPTNTPRSSGSASAIRRFPPDASANALAGCVTAGIACRSIPALSRAPTKHNSNSGLETTAKIPTSCVFVSAASSPAAEVPS